MFSQDFHVSDTRLTLSQRSECCQREKSCGGLVVRVVFLFLFLFLVFGVVRFLRSPRAGAGAGLPAGLRYVFEMSNMNAFSNQYLAFFFLRTGDQILCLIALLAWLTTFAAGVAVKDIR